MPVWDDVIPPEDLEVYDAAGYGAKQEAGSSPALLVVDVTYNFAGERGQSLIDSVHHYRNSCGPYAWAAIPVIAQLVEAARRSDIPVIYTRGRTVRVPTALGAWRTKNQRVDEDIERGERGHTIVEELTPAIGDLVFEKEKPSGFFGTSLVGHLITLGVDTLVVAGGTTSGCVRATVIDAFSYNFRVIVPEEAVFDRGVLTHKVNLFDMHAKYAQVQSAAQARDHLLRGDREVVHMPSARGADQDGGRESQDC